jgi:hypothetical protein
LNEVIADLRGFGIEEFEEILTLECGGKKVRIKLANIPTDQDLTAMLAVEGSKGYIFFQEIKVEILSRSITWINGVDLRKLAGKDRLVTDPKDGLPKDIQVVLRDTIKGWGIEIMQVLWKVLMVHSQTIENRLSASFPDAAVLTDVERRYRDRMEREIEEFTKDALRDSISRIIDADTDEETKTN